jgi:tripartite-type tricarboxylate transporter receptor subunit TctC
VDLLPIAQVMKLDLALAVSGKLPVRSLPELVAWLKANPEQATFGSPGPGGATHFLGLELGRLAKLDLRHAPTRAHRLPFPI